MQNDGIKENVAARSKQMFAALHELQQDSKTKHLIADVRGRGLMASANISCLEYRTYVKAFYRSLSNSSLHLILAVYRLKQERATIAYRMLSYLKNWPAESQQNAW